MDQTRAGILLATALAIHLSQNSSGPKVHTVSCGGKEDEK